MSIIVNSLKRFFHMESAGGITLIVAALIALIFSNTALAPVYDYLLHYHIGLIWDENIFRKPMLFWVNDVLMVIFFFLVGLEIKREFVEGSLAKVEQALLPIFAAVAGIAVPALIYVAINWNSPETMKGWAIPSATDIAFALGILALLGSRVPVSLKVFLTAVAIIDDLMAILIIAFFYTGGLDWSTLYSSPFILIFLYALNRYGVTAITPYILLGVLLWIDMEMAGIHPTLAGVLVALCIPLKAKNNLGQSPAKYLEHALHPWVAFMVLPIFGFANAGVSFEGMSFADFKDPLTLGIIGGLFIGKQIGIFSMVYLVVKTGIAKLPENSTWTQVYAVCLLCGVGFTMSLFIGTLAFDTIENTRALRLGVLTGSTLSAVMGYALLRYGPSKMPITEKQKRERKKA